MISVSRLREAIGTPAPEAGEQAQRHLDALTKPPGSLGRLEDIALRLVMLRGGFGRATAIVGVIIGALSIASIFETMVTGAFPVLVVGTSLLTIVWLVLVGRDLIRAPVWMTTPSG